MNAASTQPRLIVESADAPPFVLPPGARVVLGRSRSADLPLNDLSVSRHHCALTAKPDGVHLQDLDSASGTFINGRPMNGEVKLNDGDRIRLGNTTLRFVNGEPKSKPPPLGSRTNSDPELTLVGRAQALSPSSQTIPSAQCIPLRERLVIGRDPECDVPLESRDISRRHAEIRFESGAYTIRDLTSTNGTFLDGREVTGRMPLSEGSRVRVGPYTFQVRDARLWPECEKGRVRLSVRGLSKTVTDRTTGRALTLLDNVNLVIEPNEFVALLGPSGSGKSTLMDAMNGRRPATGGQVLINGEDFYASYPYYRRAIGHVPQKDIVHTTLTVRQALTFAARLRLPADTSEPEIERIVGEVIGKIGLLERRDTMIAHLSGGQAKRVSLGVELIADPSLLFLDEATSGLDAGTEAKLMGLFRQIANEGKTVVCITHNVENVRLCDLVIVLCQGKLVYFGPPAQLPEFFGVSHISEVYDRLETRPVAEWSNRFRTSPQFQAFVTARQQTATSRIAESFPPVAPSNPRAEPFSETWRQGCILTRRYATVLLQDRRNLLLLLAQAPLIGLLLGMVFANGTGENHRMAVFLMSISAIWFGCINASREIVKELPIYLRERAVNLELPAYLGSKIFVLAALCSAQCLALFMVVAAMTGLEPESGKLLATLLLTSWCGMLMGLVVSALVDNADKAMAIVPVLLIPQVILANVIAPLEGFTRAVASWSMVSFWSVDAMFNSIPAGRGWFSSPHHNWSEDVSVLCLFALVFTAAAMWALKRHDRLG
jgi:ABC transport system ATP-binding/permease protein